MSSGRGRPGNWPSKARAIAQRDARTWASTATPTEWYILHCGIHCISLVHSAAGAADGGWRRGGLARAAKWFAARFGERGCGERFGWNPEGAVGELGPRERDARRVPLHASVPGAPGPHSPAVSIRPGRARRLEREGAKSAEVDGDGAAETVGGLGGEENQSQNLR